MDFFLPKTGSVCADTLGPFPGFDLKTCSSENQSTCHWSSIQIGACRTSSQHVVPFPALFFSSALFSIQRCERKMDNAQTRILATRKRQYLNPEFGHKRGEVQKTGAKKYISIQGGVCY